MRLKCIEPSVADRGFTKAPSENRAKREKESLLLFLSGFPPIFPSPPLSSRILVNVMMDVIPPPFLHPPFCGKPFKTIQSPG